MWISYPENISVVKKGEAKLLNDLKVCFGGQSRNYDASIILVMYLKKIVYLLNLLCMLEFYTALLVYLFFLASQ